MEPGERDPHDRSRLTEAPDPHCDLGAGLHEPAIRTGQPFETPVDTAKRL
jgi:hypothetical protein